jgi:hypothetical protein
MTTQEQNNLDRLLTRHLDAQLNPQRGRAAAAFRAHIAQTPRSESHEPVTLKFPKMVMYGVPSLVAASLAILFTLQFVQPPSPGTRTSLPGTEASAAIPEVNEVTLTRNVDGGTTTLEDNTPVRIIRQQTYRQTDWVDPQDHASYSVSQPIEKVGYVRLQPY